MRKLGYSLLSFLLVLGCSRGDDPIVMNQWPPPAAVDTTISYLALGDSYTIGTSVAEADRWPVQLATALERREGINVRPLDLVARNGWRSDNLANALDAEPPARSYDLVSLLIGVNDQYQGFSLGGYSDRFEELLRRAIEFAGGDTSAVFVVSIPDYAYTPFGNGSEEISRAIDAFNTAAQTVAEQYEVPFYNITLISRRGLAEPALVASDNLHPSGEQYRRWVEEVLLGQVAAQIRRSH